MSNEWDQVAEEYSQAMGEQGDIWRWLLINPTIVGVLNSLPNKGNILDLGCGEGYLERLLMPLGWQMTGVDNSPVLLAKTKDKNSPGKFLLADITRPLSLNVLFDVVIANIVLMDVENMGGVYDNAYKLLKPKGLFIATIIHPAFRKPVARWAKTISEKLLRMDPFMRIDDYMTTGPRQHKIMQCSHPTTVWHRPFSTYIQLALDRGFTLTKIKELAPSKSDLIKWEQPLFLAKFPHTLFMVFSKDG